MPKTVTFTLDYLSHVPLTYLLLAAQEEQEEASFDQGNLSQADHDELEAKVQLIRKALAGQ